MRLNRSSITFLLMGSLGLFVACGTTVPPELANARAAYQRAVTGPAAQLKPSELHNAKVALEQAEQSFEDDSKSQQTKNLAYIAERKVQLAEAMAVGEQHEKQKVQAQQDLHAKQGQIMEQAKGDLATTKGELAQTKGELAVEQANRQGEAQGRLDATHESETRAKQAADALAKLGAIKDDKRGTVLTLSGSVLFATNQSTLLPEAQTRLGEVSDALQATKERNLTIEGHTDSRGSKSHNLDLSQQRAEAVRAFLVSKGYDSSKIQAHGIGKARPVAENKTAEGRANNRRVEIIIQSEPRADR